MHQFYLAEKDIGSPRARSCVSALAGLNGAAKVQLIEGNIDEALLGSAQYQVLEAILLCCLIV